MRWRGLPTWGRSRLASFYTPLGGLGGGGSGTDLDISLAGSAQGGSCTCLVSARETDMLQRLVAHGEDRASS